MCQWGNRRCSYLLGTVTAAVDVVAVIAAPMTWNTAITERTQLLLVGCWKEQPLLPQVRGVTKW